MRDAMQELIDAGIDIPISQLLNSNGSNQVTNQDGIHSTNSQVVQKNGIVLDSPGVQQQEIVS